MFGFLNKRKNIAISMLVVEYTNAGMEEGFSRSLAEEQINGSMNHSLTTRTLFPMVMIIMALYIHIDIMLNEGHEENEELIVTLQGIVSRYIVGLHKIFNRLGKDEKDVLATVESNIKSNPKYIEL
tara:strand:+ start:137 stop:514 length:378 start_codon:yes stop_codon:yes gene_type:complete